MTAVDLPNRFALPMAYGDPAFVVCLSEAIGEPEFVSNFERLRGVNLAVNKEAMRAFVEFVHDSVYLRLPDEALHSLRAAAMAA